MLGAVGRSRTSLHTLAAAFAILAALATGGCGGEERTFEPAELVEELNAEGAELKLGPVLTVNPEGYDVVSVFVADPGGGGDLGAGTMLLLEDADAAREELARCESSPLLLCFRAANGLLRFEQLLPQGRAQLEAALGAIETLP